MPASIEKHDQSSQERPSKRRRVSVEPEEPDSFKRPRLDADNLSKNCPPISREELFDDWITVTDWSRSRKMSNKMSPLPTPNSTTQSFTRAASTISVKAAVSVHDSDYREKLEQYNIHVPGETPPLGLKATVVKMVFSGRDSPEPDDTDIDNLKKIITGLQNEAEEKVRTQLGEEVIPGYKSPSDNRLRVDHGQLWSRAVAVPLDSNFIQRPLPLALPKPKPDTTFSFSKGAFKRVELATMNSLVEAANGPSYASPYPGILFPFLVIEFKSQAMDGSIRVATNQAAGAGAVALNGFLELMKRGPGLDNSDLDKLLFFSVSMDQNVAYINMEWIGKIPDSNEHSFHLEELKILPLQYDDSIRILIRAMKNIQDYALNDTLKRLVKALDAYRNKIEEQQKADSVEKPHAPPTPPPPPPSKKSREGSSFKARGEAPQ